MATVDDIHSSASGVLVSSSAEDDDVDQRRRNSNSSSSEEDDDDEVEKRFDSYSISADVSESEEEGSCCCCGSSSSGATASSLSPGHRRRPPPPPPADQVLLDFASDCCDLPATTTRPTVMFPVVGDRHVFIPTEKPKKPEFPEVEFIKERFAKLLLGEDMSGGGNGLCPALAISNAISHLAATVFGEHWKMEPLSPPKKSMWVREMEWLLCVCDSIVELVPSVQELPGGGKTFEVMVPQPRPDLSLNLPVLKKLDATLISILDGFRDSEFYYVDRGIVIGDGEYIEARLCHPSQGRPSIRLEEKWWLPFPKVPKSGLSQKTRKHLQQCWRSTNHIYKAALAINNTMLSEMEVPKVYLDSLPKSGKACLGETLYRYVTANQLPTEGLFDYLDLSSEHSTLEIANKLEAALHIWRQKYCKKDLNDKRTARSPWSGSLKGFADDEKSKISAQRAETLLMNLKLHFPGLLQTTLDMAKMRYNKDVGQAILESYSRVIESLAFNLMARIEDLLYIDDATRLRAAEESMSSVSRRELKGVFNLQNHVLPAGPVSFQLNSRTPLLKKPAFCPVAPITRKMKLIQEASAAEMEGKLERLTF